MAVRYASRLRHPVAGLRIFCGFPNLKLVGADVPTQRARFCRLSGETHLHLRRLMMRKGAETTGRSAGSTPRRPMMKASSGWNGASNSVPQERRAEGLESLPAVGRPVLQGFGGLSGNTRAMLPKPPSRAASSRFRRDVVAPRQVQHRAGRAVLPHRRAGLGRRISRARASARDSAPPHPRRPCRDCRGDRPAPPGHGCRSRRPAIRAGRCR